MLPYIKQKKSYLELLWQDMLEWISSIFFLPFGNVRDASLETELLFEKVALHQSEKHEWPCLEDNAFFFSFSMFPSWDFWCWRKISKIQLHIQNQLRFCDTVSHLNRELLRSIPVLGPVSVCHVVTETWDFSPSTYIGQELLLLQPEQWCPTLPQGRGLPDLASQIELRVSADAGMVSNDLPIAPVLKTSRSFDYRPCQQSCQSKSTFYIDFVKNNRQILTSAKWLDYW